MLTSWPRICILVGLPDRRLAASKRDFRTESPKFLRLTYDSLGHTLYLLAPLFILSMLFWHSYVLSLRSSVPCMIPLSVDRNQPKICFRYGLGALTFSVNDLNFTFNYLTRVKAPGQTMK